MRHAAVALWLALGTATGAAQSPDQAVQRIIESDSFKRATAFIESDYDRFVRELIALTEIPAPSFKEQRRARAFLDMLQAQGLSHVESDDEGNVIGLREGSARAAGGSHRPIVAVVAHLDTVFPEGTDVRVKRDGTRLLAPGISDDTRGLAVMLAVIRAINAARYRTATDLLFVGSVGEEGEGDLRGVKHLLHKGKYRDRIKQFIAIDGSDQGSIIRGGVGSRRYRVTFKGPGGHSYGSFGLVNPAFAMSNAIAKFSRIQVPTSPKTTFNVGVLSGGTSVNSIPFETHMDVDMRSESCAELMKLDEAFLALVREAVDDENRLRSTREGRVEAAPKLIGDRPCGETAADAPLVLTTAAAVKALGLTPSYHISSTDANIPMSIGIPAVTIGRGPGGRAHAPDEWTDVNRPATVQSIRVVTAIILAAGGGE